MRDSGGDSGSGGGELAVVVVVGSQLFSQSDCQPIK